MQTHDEKRRFTKAETKLRVFRVAAYGLIPTAVDDVELVQGLQLGP